METSRCSLVFDLIGAGGAGGLVSGVERDGANKDQYESDWVVFPLHYRYRPNLSGHNADTPHTICMVIRCLHYSTLLVRTQVSYVRDLFLSRHQPVRSAQGVTEGTWPGVGSRYLAATVWRSRTNMYQHSSGDALADFVASN